MADRPKVLAGILYSGEPTLSRAIDALEAQQDIDLRIVVIGGFGEWEAHRRLYRTFNETGTDVDLFVKVDADMIILHDRMLATLSTFLADHAPLDRITIGVYDWLSDASIPGMHAWRSSVRWLEDPPELQTDLARDTVRAKLSYIDPPVPLVLHAPEPTDLQAARYGARRALKASARPTSGWEWGRLEGLLLRALADPEPARRIAAAAVSITFDEPERMRSFVMEQGQAEETLLALRSSAAAWPGIAEKALVHVRAGLRRAGRHAQVRASTPPAPETLLLVRRVTARLLRPSRVYRSLRRASVPSLPPDTELAERLSARLESDGRA